jgi:hypothetical protein
MIKGFHINRHIPNLFFLTLAEPCEIMGSESETNHELDRNQKRNPDRIALIP